MQSATQHLSWTKPLTPPAVVLPLKTGIITGLLAIYSAAVGILKLFFERDVIVDTLTLGDLFLATLAACCGAYVWRKSTQAGHIRAAQAFAAGLIAGLILVGLVVAVTQLNLRWMFTALSADLSRTLTYKQGALAGSLMIIAASMSAALCGALLMSMSDSLRRSLLWSMACVLIAGVFQELIQISLRFGGAVAVIRELLYVWGGLTVQGAAIVFFFAFVVLQALDARKRRGAATTLKSPAPKARSQLASALLLIAVLIAFPLVAGSYIGQVMMLVSLSVLMGMGLNIEVGLAGLLDMGFVAFFAVGAYTIALLTADSEYALAQYTFLPSLNFWSALPFAVLAATLVGVLFGLPVLSVKGDYLAVATLGLGEIVRVLVISDAAKPVLGGAQGILQIPKPHIGSFELADPVSLFYLTLVFVLVAAYIAWRLEGSRLGRAWMAIRDDEDVAQALGINLVQSKLLAYGLGAAFAGLAGAIFATMLTSVYPHSFSLLISINVLALLIVGGMGSLPGVIVGAILLIGLPEVLREFDEYRYLFYGALLIVVMRVRPEGLWPSPQRKRELRAAEKG
ncbi:branched-chain amino acid ABC transporter permease [Mesorhizobium muleiense]|uniref:branched-chain amino acid ABC transporter permease n=1 Tax=Mesorhizobium muleiense TaxID=1004279 RepID=UPI001F37867B|nr:branched-chain amino acid ABC transporter permease [Mesorhizobium muleiense]MCF6108444.1 branched-chain amino acid ABC transporter permease [Mesorhizobium muleiense]